MANQNPNQTQRNPDHGGDRTNRVDDPSRDQAPRQQEQQPPRTDREQQAGKNPQAGNDEQARQRRDQQR